MALCTLVTLLGVSLALLCGCTGQGDATPRGGAGPGTPAAIPVLPPVGLPALPLERPDRRTRQQMRAAAELPLAVANRVPILMYHVIGDGPNTLFVSETDFRRQMEYLAHAGYHAVSMAQVAAAFRGDGRLPEHPIVISFDDGYVSAYTAALPILEEFHLAGTFYIVTGFVDQPRYLTWEQVLALDRAGMEIGSHTRTHPDLTKLGAKGLELEVAGAKQELQKRLGHVVEAFCYPTGAYSDAVVAAVRKAGYTSATTTRPGLATRQQDPMLYTRVRVWRGESLPSFIARLQDDAGAAAKASATSR